MVRSDLLDLRALLVAAAFASFLWEFTLAWAVEVPLVVDFGIACLGWLGVT